MTKNQRIFMWVMIAIVAVLIIYVIIVSKNKPVIQPAPTPINPNTGKPEPPTAASKAGVDTTVPPTQAQSVSIKPLAKIYAGEDVLNSYDTCPPNANILNTFSKGDYIGEYTRTEGNCIIVSKNTTFLGIPTGSTDNYLLYNANIYVK